MAKFDLEQMEKHRAEEKAIEKERRSELNTRYGEDLGTAFYNHVYEGDTYGEIDIYREVFIERISEDLINGSPLAKTRAVHALVAATDTKIELAERRVRNVPNGQSPI